ncbi:MAG TPA: cohesin domain-containing protein, partial [Anaerolineales bacterium]|nr:cohesin domain-containing protein [Anaerolineales bacterium]
MKLKHLPRAILLLVLLASLIPMGSVVALSTAPVPPADFFQLPWEQGLAWYAIDGIDNGAKRPLSSSHNYTVGGAIDFAPRKYMVKGEDTSNFWVAAAGPGTVVGISTCHVILDHGNGWVTQYQFLGNIQVSLGQSVERNQRLGIIADGVRYRYCLGSIDPDIPHLHFMLRPTMIGATFAGWEVNYYSFFSSTTFTKDGVTVGLYKPLLNTFGSTTTTSTPATSTPITPTPTGTQPTPTEITPTPTGPHSSTEVDQPNIDVGETTVVRVNLNNVPLEGYTSAEFTCTYDPSILEVSNITATDLFGTDPAVAIQGPQNGNFIVAIAGSHDQKATTDGTAFTFNVTGLQAGQTTVECKVRVNNGDGVLMELPSIGTVITVDGLSPTSTPTFTPSPTISPTPTMPNSICDKAEFIADINIPTGTLMLPGAMFTKTWRLKNVGS